MKRSLSGKLGFSIRAKLSFWFFIEALIVIGIFAVLVRWSFDRGFLQYIASVNEQRTEELVSRLAVIHEKDHGWQKLENDRKQWVDLVMVVSGHTTNGDISFEQLYDAFPLTGFPKDLPAPLPLRFVLLDQGRHILIGPRDPKLTMKLFPIRGGRNLYGYVGVLNGPSFRNVYDVQFGQQFSATVLLAAAAMGLLALSLAYALSSRFIKPIEAIGEVIKRLASGRYKTRFKMKLNDEFGELGRACNDLAAALEKHERMQKQWIADISHELRTPVSVLRAGIEAVQDGVRPANKETIEGLHQQIIQLTRLIQDLYDLSLSDTGSLAYKKERVDLSHIVANAGQAMMAGFSDKAIKFTIRDQAGGQAMLQADPARMHQLFVNVFSNALRYTNAGGEVKVALFVSARFVQIDIEDSEPGVDAKDLPRLFDRLFRADASRSRNEGGAGLGLAIAKSIVEAHGGTIEALHSPLGGLHIRLRFKQPGKTGPAYPSEGQLFI